MKNTVSLNKKMNRSRNNLYGMSRDTRDNLTTKAGMIVFRLNRLIGLPVICAGEKLGKIEMAGISKSGDSITGFTVRKGISGVKWLEKENIMEIGGISVLSKEKMPSLGRREPSTISMVTDSDGLIMGWVTDMLLDKELRILSLEVSAGPLDDVLHGRLHLTGFSMHAARGQGSSNGAQLTVIAGLCRAAGERLLKREVDA